MKKYIVGIEQNSTVRFTLKNDDPAARLENIPMVDTLLDSGFTLWETTRVGYTVFVLGKRVLALIPKTPLAYPPSDPAPDLEGFTKAIFEEYFPDCMDIDGGDLQDLAIKYNVLVGKTVYQPCGEFCNCAENAYAWEFDSEDGGGVTCYHLNDRLQRHLQTPSK